MFGGVDIQNPVRFDFFGSTCRGIRVALMKLEELKKIREQASENMKLLKDTSPHPWA